MAKTKTTPTQQKSYNRVQLAGRLVADPEIRDTASGKTVCRMRLATNDTREALRLIAAGVIKAEQFITHRFPFTALHDAYRNAAEARDSLKTVVEFP